MNSINIIITVMNVFHYQLTMDDSLPAIRLAVPMHAHKQLPALLLLLYQVTQLKNYCKNYIVN